MLGIGGPGGSLKSILGKTQIIRSGNGDGRTLLTPPDSQALQFVSPDNEERGNEGKLRTGKLSKKGQTKKKKIQKKESSWKIQL